MASATDTTSELRATPTRTKPEPAISASGLTKRYGDVEVVRGVDLEVEAGEIFAFLGPNGAGKTTTVEILAGLQDRSDGEVRVLGRDPARHDGSWRNRLGIVLQETQPEPGLTVRESLELYAGYYERPRGVEETLALAGLEEKATSLAARLSGGQRRRLDVALALIGDPELIFLDEPTTGFDPSARQAAWDVIDDLRSLGKTIFLTTHSMEEAERLADRIAVIADGRIVASGPPQALGSRDLIGATIRFSLPAGLGPQDLPPSLAPLAENAGGGRAAISTTTPLVHLLLLGEWALGQGLDLPDIDVHRPTLEEVYLELTATRKEN
jgi:ABC-2 type transport system ATP-binding protein